MKRYLVAAAVAASMTLVGAPAQAAEIGITVTGTTTRPVGPSPDCTAFACLSAQVAGFGAATWQYYPGETVPFSTSCGTLSATAVITLADGNGELTLAETDVVCNPGASYNAPGSFKSYGNPFRITGTFTVVSATGSLSGLTGGGTVTVSGNGARLAASYTS